MHSCLAPVFLFARSGYARDGHIRKCPGIRSLGLEKGDVERHKCGLKGKHLFSGIRILLVLKVTADFIFISVWFNPSYHTFEPRVGKGTSAVCR
jgi:hypothetical protein